MTKCKNSKYFTLLNARDMIDLALFIETKSYWNLTFYIDGSDEKYQYRNLWEYIDNAYNKYAIVMIEITEDSTIRFYDGKGSAAIDMKEVV